MTSAPTPVRGSALGLVVPWLVFVASCFVVHQLLAPIADWPAAQKYLHPINVLEGALVAPVSDGASGGHAVALVACAIVLYLSFAEGLRRLWHVSQPVAALVAAIPFVKLLFGFYYIFGDSAVITRLLYSDVSLDTQWTYFLVGGTRAVFFTYRDLTFLFTSMAIFPAVVVGAFAADVMAGIFGATRGLAFVPRERSCPKCGGKIAVDATYCRRCGVVFAEMEAAGPNRDVE